MKKFKVLFAAIVFAGISAVSCSSDDDGAAVSGNIEGKWNPIKTTVKLGNETFNQPYDENDPACDKDYVEFASAGVFNTVIYFENANQVCEDNAASPGTWGRSDNTVTIAGSFDYSGTYEIVKLNNNELRLQDVSSSGGVTTTTTVFFTKVN